MFSKQHFHFQNHTFTFKIALSKQHFHFSKEHFHFQLLTTMLPRFTFPSPLLYLPFLLLSPSHAGSNETSQPPNLDQPNDQPRRSNNQPRTFYIGGVLSSETTAHAFTMEAQVNIIATTVNHLTTNKLLTSWFPL